MFAGIDPTSRSIAIEERERDYRTSIRSAGRINSVRASIRVGYLEAILRYDRCRGEIDAQAEKIQQHLVPPLVCRCLIMVL